MIGRLALIFAGLLLSGAAAAQGGAVTPLFADDAPLAITLTGPIGSIVRNAPRSTDPQPALLEANGEQHAIELSARGISRRQRNKCKFPPLLVNLEAKAGAASTFHRQNKIKLVTHCSDGAEAQQHVLREYAAYRLYNAITPQSLKVRLVRVTYREAQDSPRDGKGDPARWGFLIEDADDAARRLGVKETRTGNLPLAAINPQDGARVALFQYLIGNTDWEMIRGVDPADCCHNTRLLGDSKEARSGLIPLPYDFDNSGLVDAPYAFANPDLRIRTVRTRVYRGFCVFNGQLPAQLDAFRAARPEMERELRAIPGVEQRTRDTMLSYVEGFFSDLDTPEKIESRLLRRCRT